MAVTTLLILNVKRLITIMAILRMGTVELAQNSKKPLSSRNIPKKDPRLMLR